MQCIVHDIIQHAKDKKTTIAMIPVASMLYIVYNDGIFMLLSTYKKVLYHTVRIPSLLSLEEEGP